MECRAGVALALLVPLLTGQGVAGTVCTTQNGGCQCPDPAEVPTCTGPQTIGEYFAAVVDPAVYDKTARPACGNGTHEGPTTVETQLFVSQVNKVDTKLNTMVLNGYWRTWWTDPRLAFTGKDGGGCLDTVNIPKKYAHLVWQPDLYVDNLISMSTKGMRGLIEIFPSGRVWRSEQVLLTVKVGFDLSRLPYDKHEAKVAIASFSQDISRLRLIARGGTVGDAVSGIGLKAEKINSETWTVGEEDPKIDGVISTPGVLTTKDNWDYVALTFKFARKERYFLGQVIIPCLLFMIVSYIQFFVDAAAVPARSMLAVMPVLIMLLMSISIYASIPENSKNMWLDDVLTTSMILCNAAAVHFGVVQFFRLKEKERALKLQGLKNARSTSEKLTAIARREGIPLLKLLEKYDPIEKDITRADMEKEKQKLAAEADLIDDSESDENWDANTENSQQKKKKEEKQELAQGPANEESAGSQEVACKMRVTAPGAQKDGILESDVLFIHYASDIFNMFDKDSSNDLDSNDLQHLLTYFNIYMSRSQVIRVGNMFLRDTGVATPAEGRDCHLRFSQVARLLVNIESYNMRSKKDYRTIRALFQGMSPSHACDVIARFVFPGLVCTQFLGFYILLWGGAY